MTKSRTSTSKACTAMFSVLFAIGRFKSPRLGKTHSELLAGDDPLGALEVDFLPSSLDQFGFPHHAEDQEMQGKFVRAFHARLVDGPHQLADFLRRQRHVSAPRLGDEFRFNGGSRVELGLLPGDGVGEQAFEHVAGLQRHLVGAAMLDPVGNRENVVGSHLGKQFRADGRNHVFGIKGYHDLRAAWVCDRYLELANRHAPVVMQNSPPDELPEEEAEAVETLSKELGLELAQALGHDRLDILAAYIGSHRC